MFGLYVDPFEKGKLELYCKIQLLFMVLMATLYIDWIDSFSLYHGSCSVLDFGGLCLVYMYTVEKGKLTYTCIAKFS